MNRQDLILGLALRLDVNKNDKYFVNVAQSFLSDYLGRVIDPAALTPLSGGSVNKIFQFDGKLVVRIGSGNQSRQVFQKEKWCIEQALAVGVSTPQVLATRDLDDGAAMLLPMIDGPDAISSPSRFQEVWRKLGEYACRFNSVDVSGFGKTFLVDDLAAKDWGFWTQNQVSLFENSLSRWGHLLSQRLLHIVRERLLQMGQWQFQPVLCHANIGLQNVRLDSKGKAYLLDWGDAGGYPGFWDLAEISAWHRPDHASIRCFCEGYGFDDKQRRDLQHQLLQMQTWRWASGIQWASERSEFWRDEPVVQLSLERIRDSVSD